MKSLLEFLNINVKPSIIYATNETIRDIVKSEIDRLGFEADLNHIDVSKVNDFDGLFSATENEIRTRAKRLGKKYKTINPDISRWNTENATNFDSMFLGCEKFNCDLSEWKTSKVQIMSYMFCLCNDFCSDISEWDLSSCKRINGMFSHAKSFDCDISKWDVSNVWDMEYTFYEAFVFSHDLSNWNVSNVTSHKDCFSKCNKNNWPIYKRPKFNKK